jgi:hemoglobin
MSLLDTTAEHMVAGTTWLFDAAPGPTIPIAMVTTATVGAWLLWRSLHPFPGEATAPTGPVAHGSPAAMIDLDRTVVVASGKPRGEPSHIVVTSSAMTGTNIGPDGRTAYATVGPDHIRAAVEQFFNAVLADPALAPYFKRVDMDRLRRHQALFIGQLWGGPVHFELERLTSAHRHLHISTSAYWRTVAHLMTVLVRLDVPDWVRLFTLATLHDVQHMVVNEGATAAADDETDPVPDGPVEVPAPYAVQVPAPAADDWVPPSQRPYEGPRGEHADCELDEVCKVYPELVHRPQDAEVKEGDG